MKQSVNNSDTNTTPLLVKITQIVKNMGIRYVAYRSLYEFKKRSGFLKKQFPTNPPTQEFISLEKFRSLNNFLFNDYHEPQLEKISSEKLETSAKKILSGSFPFFSAGFKDLGSSYNWSQNPDSLHIYDNNLHWSKISDFKSEYGDIKYVWETSRFSWLLTLIRYDFHFETNSDEYVFSKIEDWIDNNPVNQGPNWICSQEISLRLLNWAYALAFYKNSAFLTENLWKKLQNTIYWSLHHIYENINFSRYTVRNNHAITETLCLALSEIIFPYISDTKKWAKNGRSCFEEEIGYQIYDDGTFLQFSMNYHRVVIQLLTLGIALTEKSGNKFSESVYIKADKSLEFLSQCMQLENGFLPNYGSNDGALFFPLNNSDYRDYRPQLNALHVLLKGSHLFEESELREDAAWFNIKNQNSLPTEPLRQKDGALCFPIGGYYLIRDNGSFIFIRCGKHKDRPAHADNLHIDLWHNGINILCDSGTFKYNTSEELRSYFMGSKGHNTVSIGNESQMKSGGRFIWFFWSQAKDASIEETDEAYIFKGTISAFNYLDKNAKHHRELIKYKSRNDMLIVDRIKGKFSATPIQNWHLNDVNSIASSAEEDGVTLLSEAMNSYQSHYYGEKKDNIGISYSFKNSINTKISY